MTFLLRYLPRNSAALGEDCRVVWMRDVREERGVVGVRRITIQY